MPEERDIGQLASLARTALTDPAALPESYGQLTGPNGYLPRADVAVGFLDEIIALTDPRDDEREFANYADGLDALGRSMERIREQVVGAMNGGTSPDARLAINVTDTNVADALDLIDAAVSRLRDAQEAADAADLHCEDCEVNGEECATHGEAWKIARRAVLENPGRVLALLREEVSL